MQLTGKGMITKTGIKCVQVGMTAHVKICEKMSVFIFFCCSFIHMHTNHYSLWQQI